jgi:DNA-binding transcriptional ArsR family regulator
LEYREIPIYICVMDQLEIFKALSNKSRLQFLQWLRDPELHFPEQDNDFSFGVCVGMIQKKSGLTQSTVSENLTILLRAGLIESTRIGQWTYYKRNEASFKALTELIENDL